MTFFGWLKSLFPFKRRAADAPPFSVVLLLRHHQELTEQRIHAAIRAVWGRGPRGDDEYVVYQDPVSVVRMDGRMFLLNSIPQPYGDDPQAAASVVGDLRQRKLLQEHQAWMSVDLLSPQTPKGDERDECYRYICRMAANFLDDTCLGVYFPESGNLRPHDAELQQALEDDKPLDAITRWENSPVLLIDSKDPALQAA